MCNKFVKCVISLSKLGFTGTECFIDLECHSVE